MSRVPGAPNLFSDTDSPGGIVAYIDGGARGNPGPAGFGVRIESPDGQLLEEFGQSIGVATNNVAEYRGLLAALEWSRAHGHSTVHVRSDSLLLVQQMLGNYKVKNAGLQPLHTKARLLSHEIGNVTFEHVRREQNTHADRLANFAMDGAAGAPPASAADATAAAPASTAAVSDPLSARDRAVRLFVYEQFVETATAPDTATIAAGIKASSQDVESALLRLASARALVLAPATRTIWMAHPFSAVPTMYPVEARGKRYWANCAWDAAGVLSLVGDGQARTRCADCGAELALAVHNGAISGEGVVHFAVPPRRFWENVAFT